MTFEQKFLAVYTTELQRRYESDPDYAYSKAHISAEDLAIKMTNSMKAGTANIQSSGIRAALKQCGVKPTYKAVKAAFHETSN